jgi:ABC-type multidrug transport system fused ATPase/permease subunit
LRSRVRTSFPAPNFFRIVNYLVFAEQHGFADNTPFFHLRFSGMTQAIVIEHLEKQYPGGLQALKGISLTVEQGDFFALLGPNGAGKSTTIGILCSLITKTAGKVAIFGDGYR